MKPNHTDDRGTITDLLVTPEYSVTHITFTEGAVRGNHYHKATVQHDFILKGRLECAKESSLTGKKITEVYAGEKIVHVPMESHAYEAIEPSEMISVCFGIRRGQDYAKDTFKLETPLL